MNRNHHLSAFGARGDRPVSFVARLDRDDLFFLTSIPGVAPAPGGVCCTWDIAPVVAKALGQPCPKPPVEWFMTDAEYDAEIAKLPGLGKYLSYGFSKPGGLRDYQKEGAVFLARRTAALNCDPMRCVAGETEISLRLGTQAQRRTISKLFKRQEEKRETWNAVVKVQSLATDARFNNQPIRYVRANPLCGVINSGYRPVVKVTATTGYEIRCTPEHKFYCPDDRGGFREVEAGKLRVGDPVMVLDTWPSVAPRYVVSVEDDGYAETFDLMAAAPLHSYVANGFVVANSGKSAQAIAGSVLLDARRVLVVAPAIVKYAWAAENAKWTGRSSVILDGRAGTKARLFCTTCLGVGRVVDKSTVSENWPPCPACRFRGRSRGYIPIKGRDAVHAAIEESSMVICNYDILTGQVETDATGTIFPRADLPGQGLILARHEFQVAVIDEIHSIRGFARDEARKGRTRRDRVCQAIDNIPYVWGLTGTLIYGFIIDTWGPIDCIFAGAATSRGDRKPFTWGKRYCDAQHGEYGWVDKGRSALADTELPERLKYFRIARPRSMILKDMPPKQRMVIRIDDEDAKKTWKIRVKAALDAESRIKAMMRKTYKIKQDKVVEMVIDELAEGNKVICYTFLKKSAHDLARAVNGAMTEKTVVTRLREAGAKIWWATGDIPVDGRIAMAAEFRLHPGAAVWVSTAKSVEVGISLNGATSVFYVDLDWTPATMQQAEDRCYEPGISRMTVLYFVVKGSIDEDMEAQLLPKLRAQDGATGEQAAQQMLTAFVGPTRKESARELLDRVKNEIIEVEDDDLLDDELEDEKD